MPDKKCIQLGDEIEDVTSKTSGIAIAKVECLNGAIYWRIQPFTTDDNMIIKPTEIEDEYCKRIGDGVRIKAKPMMGFRARDESAG